MKTKLYIEPGTQLDWDNENHRRHIEAEAFSEPRHPKPTMKAPPRSRFWWFWRAFGYLVFMPARMAWRYYRHARYLTLPDGNLGQWNYRFKSSETVERWLWYGRKSQKWMEPVRKFFYWLFVQNYSICPHCGYTCYEDEIRIHDKTVNMFEHLEGGGVNYYGEGEDAHGWMWCYRCGSVSWETI